MAIACLNAWGSVVFLSGFCAGPAVWVFKTRRFRGFVLSMDMWPCLRRRYPDKRHGCMGIRRGIPSTEFRGAIFEILHLNPKLFTLNPKP